MSKEIGLSCGVNKKVGSDTVILNMCSAHNCPSKKLGLCQLGSMCNRCYAFRTELIRPTVKVFRDTNEILWQINNSKEIASTILSMAKKPHRDVYTHKKEVVTTLRFSEAGDFKSQEDVDKMSEVAELLKGKIKVYGYTARKDLNYSNVSENMVVNGSGFMAHNEFKVITPRLLPLLPPDALICLGNCRNCNMCKERLDKTIYVKLH